MVFFANLSIYQGMAKALNTNPDFLMALSSIENGWLDSHNQGLHNLFGVRHGAEITYRSTHIKKRLTSGSTHSVPMFRMRRQSMHLLPD
jgi:hypothetical protein